MSEGERVASTTSASINSVLSFYDYELTEKSLKLLGYNLGEWQKNVDNETTSYSCYGGDINLLTTETGCIYIRASGEDTLIEAVRYRSEGGHVPCLAR
jgi:hypothetical protein